MERRSFLKLSCGLGAGILLSSLGVSVLPIEAFAQELTKYDRIKTAKQSTTHNFEGFRMFYQPIADTKTGKIINIEGDPEHPINEGSLCAKGAGIYQTTAANDRRLDKVLYRAPYGDKWEEKDWDFAIDRIARHLKEERDAGFVTKNANGQTVNRVESVAHLGSSNVDSEECWSMAVFARSYGLVYIDHQARV